MKNLTKVLLGCASALAFTATTASAEVVCNEDGDCWRTKSKYEYKPEFKVKVYPDNWKWADAEEKKYRWREHDGRGYWRQGIWIDF